MPTEQPDASQLQEVSFISEVTADGRIAQYGLETWSSGGQTIPATFEPEKPEQGESAHKWAGGAAGTPGGTVSYAFDPGSGFTPAMVANYQAALALWSDEANIRFEQVADPDAAELILYLPQTTTPGPVLQSAAYTSSTVAWGDPGSGILPATRHAYVVIPDRAGYGDLSSITASAGFGVQTIVHELGHALGLGHGGPYNGDKDNATQQYTAYDNRAWSVMSYISPDQPARYSGDPGDVAADYRWGSAQVSTTPQMLDILAAQRLYGAPGHGALCGGQTFGFNCTVSDASSLFFDFTRNIHPVVTLFDTGARNTLDLSGFAQDARVDLDPGTFSDCDGMVGNIAIAYGTAIDAAIGGAGNDSFTLNDGSDTIDGRGGTNTVILDGLRARYLISRSADDVVTVSDGTVTDTLRNIQLLRFRDAAAGDTAVAVDDLPVAPAALRWVPGDGSFADPGRWADAATGAPAGAAPDSGTDAVLDGPAGGAPQAVSGNGEAAQLLLTGLDLLTGHLRAGVLTVGTGAAPAAVTAAGILEAGTAAVVAGTLSSTGTIAVDGALSIDTSLELRERAALSAGSLSLRGGTVEIGHAATAVVGTGAAPFRGWLVIGQDGIVAGYGTLTEDGFPAGIGDNGVLHVTGGTLSAAGIRGSGAVDIADGATLSLGQGASTAITFDGAAGTLDWNSTASLREARVSGFRPGDVISVRLSASQGLHPVFHDDTDTLDVVDGTDDKNPVFVVHLTGDYSRDNFLLRPTTAGTYTIEVAPGSPGSATPPSTDTSGHKFGWIANGTGNWNDPSNWLDITAERRFAADNPDAV
ncbi:MAG: M10 family metallopeptidase C-terminal domain-containing protein, partial [Gluconacetobacter diazotrophicus]|nr:M10 family metallopeptidase C-terminal domain-containing protein [Gluconacetobacter diazotrophicus]